MEVENNRRSDREEKIQEMELEHAIPVSWGEGPVRNQFRTVTDKCCLVIFLLYLVLMIGTMAYALTNSDPDAISRIYDSEKNACGEDNAKDYPLLFLNTFSKPYRSVCVIVQVFADAGSSGV